MSTLFFLNILRARCSPPEDRLEGGRGRCCSKQLSYIGNLYTLVIKTKSNHAVTLVWKSDARGTGLGFDFYAGCAMDLKASRIIGSDLALDQALVPLRGTRMLAKQSRQDPARPSFAGRVFDYGFLGSWPFCLKYLVGVIGVKYVHACVCNILHASVLAS